MPEPEPLLCRLGWHRWDVWAMDYRRWVERVCRRGSCTATERRAWHDKRWVPEPIQRCTHGVGGVSILACMRCANERPHPW